MEHHSYTLMLTDTLTGTKRPFKPANPEHVTMYVCGITPYDYAHIGHGRCYVTFDVVYRLLELLGYKVIYCRNFTDIDDKLINRAEKELNNSEEYLSLANKFIQAYHEDMKALNCLPPAYEPRVTLNIPQIINFVHSLILSGNAYLTDEGDVYFSIESFPDYGKLSKRDLSELLVGARVTIREDKVNPLDFALWKKADKAPGWKSPWSFGRPGWHIECSAFVDTYLGKTIDIHGGGMDLIFPHHENEIAQSEGLHQKPLARYWLHNAFVRIHQEKMSKSLGNFITLRDMCEQYDPMVVRYYYLLHHYRNPLDFSHDDIVGAAKSYQRLCKFFEPYDMLTSAELCFEEAPIVSELIEALCDDINGAKFFGIIFDNLKHLQEDPAQAGIIKALIDQVLGLPLEALPEQEVIITAEVQLLIDAREAARKAKDWKRADELRDELKQLGIEVQDKKL